MNCHTDVMSSQLFTGDELVKDKLFDTNLSDDEEEDVNVIPPYFHNDIDIIEKQ